jgi:hypothetical protein
MLKYLVPFAFVLFAISHANAWTKYGGDMNCRELLTLVDADDQTSEQMARGWTLGYISALNEMMQQSFDKPPEEELIWRAVKGFCEDNLDASHYVASASVYIEVLRAQGGPK